MSRNQIFVTFFSFILLFQLFQISIIETITQYFYGTYTVSWKETLYTSYSLYRYLWCYHRQTDGQMEEPFSTDNVQFSFPYANQTQIVSKQNAN